MTDGSAYPHRHYRSVEKDIGMTLAHKDAGLYDSEALEFATTPGIRLRGTCRNRVRTDTVIGPTREDRRSGHSCPEYLVSARTAEEPRLPPHLRGRISRLHSGQNCGQEPTTAATFDPSTRTRTPTYGTHGSFTAKNYATSRYVQSGGFRGSAYASNRDGIGYRGSRNARPDLPHSSVAPAPTGAGKRFGSGISPSSGRRFGRSGGVGPKLWTPTLTFEQLH